jgi:hypothetical protein
MATSTKKKDKDDPKISGRFKRPAMCSIGDREKEKKRERVIEALTEINLQNEQMEPFKAKVKELKMEVERLRGEVKTGREEREVTCVNEFYFKQNLVKVRRVDNREIVEERPMTDEDRQEHLPSVPAPDPRPTGEGQADDEDGDGDGDPPVN